MLRPMILKDSFDFMDKRNGPEITKENNHPNDSIGQIEEESAFGQEGDEPPYPFGQKKRNYEKEEKPKAKGKRKGKADRPRTELLLLLSFREGLLGREIKGSNPQDKGGH